jgi:hypothetical protein
VEKRNGHSILIKEHGGQKLHGRPKVKGQYNIKMTLKK